nr:PREDICTED: nanos homolog 1-like [Lepisosteus oculatus]
MEPQSGATNFNPWRDYLQLKSTLLQEAPGSRASSARSAAGAGWHELAPPGLGAKPRGPGTASTSASGPGPGPKQTSNGVGCTFCRKNEEAPAVYTSHLLKRKDGTVSCPILRKYTCPLCGATGDRAHTVNYCPRRGVPSATGTAAPR